MALQVNKKCFVCNEDVNENEVFINKTILLPVCKKCIGTNNEKKAEKDALDSLAEDFVSGCI